MKMTLATKCPHRDRKMHAKGLCGSCHRRTLEDPKYVKASSRPPYLKLVSLVKSRTVRTFEDACNELNVSPKILHQLIGQANADNYAVELVGDSVAIRPSMPSEVVTDVRIAQAGKVNSFATISDPHFASKFHLRSQLLDFVDQAYASGVRTILLPGDNLDGCYRHGRFELSHHGFRDQVHEFREGLPQRPGLNYWGITGNHDQTFEESGMVVHEAINEHFRSNGRKDLTMLGARGAYVRLLAKGSNRGVFVELWHPLKGPAYALTYKLQKKVEGYAPGQKPDFVFAGHWHQAVYCLIRGVHAFSCGTFQGGGSSFSKSLGGAPTIGGWIVKFAVTPEGTVREVHPRWVGYYEKEIAREVALG